MNLSEPKGPASPCRGKEGRWLLFLVTFSVMGGGILGGTEAVVANAAKQDQVREPWILNLLLGSFNSFPLNYLAKALRLGNVIQT